MNERYWSGELRHICKDGREVTVDSRMQLLGDDTVLEVNRDVTRSKFSIFSKQRYCENWALLPPNLKLFSTNLASSLASWTCKAMCGK